MVALSFCPLHLFDVEIKVYISGFGRQSLNALYLFQLLLVQGYVSMNDICQNVCNS